MGYRLLILATLTVCTSSYSQDYSGRLTIQEVSDITISKMLFETIRIDSVLRTKGFQSQKMKNDKLAYFNSYGDLYQWGYNKEIKILFIMLSTNDYDYYKQMKKVIAEKYEYIKAGSFSSYDLAEYYKTGVFTYVTGVNSENNDYIIATMTPLESYPDDK